MAKNHIEKRAQIREAINGYIFASPWLLGFFIFTLGPLMYSLYLSFTRYNMLEVPKFTGLLNFKEMFTQDPQYFKSMYNTVYYVLISVPLSITFGLLAAVLLNQKVKGMKIFRTIFYLPNVIPIVVVAVTWQWILEGNFGLINTVLAYFGIEGPMWLAEAAWAKPALILMGLWTTIGGGTIIYLAGLQGISLSFYESATVDGASSIRKFFSITLPIMSPTIFYNLVMGIIGGLQIFLPAFMMCTASGLPNGSTLFYGLHLFNNAFHDRRLGYASAMAWVLLVITLVLTLIVMKTSSSWVYYEDDSKK